MKNIKNKSSGTTVGVLLELQKLTQRETSNYAKILFQENIIHFFILVALESIEGHYNNKTDVFKIIDGRKNIYTNPIRIEFDTKYFEGKTLGALCGILSSFLGNDEELKKDLEKFIKIRNNMTHKMLYKYKTFLELERDSLESVKRGEKVVKKLEEFIGKIF